VVTNDGKTHEFEVSKVSNTSLHDGQVSILFSDISQLQVKRCDITNNVLLVVAIVAVGAAAGDERQNEYPARHRD
jgi:hypothetical protein